MQEVDENVKPRFEFRSFGQEFAEAAYRMSRLSVPVPEFLWQRQSAEIYLLSSNSNVANVKIRDELLDIKSLVQTVDGLEQWEPQLKVEFPLSVETLWETVLPALEVSAARPSCDSYTLDTLLTLVRDIPELQSVRVSKTRHAYTINDTICEVATVLINGAGLSTISVESTDIAAIQKTLRETGLLDIENINYLQAIKRVTGMLEKPLAN